MSSIPTSIQNCLLGVKSKNHSELVKDVLSDTAPPPSCIQCILGDCCGRKKRVPSGIQDVPEISNLAGLLHQNGADTVFGSRTNGTIFTLKWADYDKETRTAVVQVYGGYGPKASTGYWSILDNQKWRTISCLGRICNYSYFFTFSEDYQRADINMKVNLGCLCCKPWFKIPASLIGKFEMEQYPDSKNGSHWKRNSAKSADEEFSFAYSVETAYKSDGTPTEYAEQFEEYAPKTMLLTR